MSHWVAEIEPSEWTAIAAAFIAAISLISQAASGRRQARLALLQKRLDIYLTVNNAMGEAYAMITITWHPRGIEGEKQRTFPAEALLSVQSRASVLFGPEILPLLDRARVVAGRIELSTFWNPSIGLERPDRDEAKSELIILGGDIERAFMRYFKKDRAVGLSWFDRAAAAQEEEYARRTKQAPYAPGSSL